MANVHQFSKLQFVGLQCLLNCVGFCFLFVFRVAVMLFESSWNQCRIRSTHFNGLELECSFLHVSEEILKIQDGLIHLLSSPYSIWWSSHPSCQICPTAKAASAPAAFSSLSHAVATATASWFDVCQGDIEIMLTSSNSKLASRSQLNMGMKFCTWSQQLSSNIFWRKH